MFTTWRGEWNVGKGKKKYVDPVQMINIEVTYCIKTQDKHEVK